MDQIIRYIFIIICLTGCLYQIYEISVIYFSYETTTDVRYEDEAITQLPAITFCVPKVSMIKKEYLNQLVSNLTDPSIEISKNFNALTIKEQFKALYTAEELFNEKCFVRKTYALKSTEKYVNCHLVSDIKLSINYFNLCIRLFSQMNRESDEKYQIDYDFITARYNEHIAEIQFPSFSPAIYLIMNSRNQFIRNCEEKNSLLIYGGKSNRFYVEYRKTDIQLMPKPYKTSCFNYEKLGHISRADCIFKCVTNNYKKSYNRWPMDYLTEDSETDLKTIEFFNETEDLKIRKICKNFCGFNDCFKEIFELKEMKKMEFPEKNNKSIRIYIYPPYASNLLLIHSAKIRIEEFLCYTASIFSLWFGFSVFMLTDVLVLIIKKFYIFRNKILVRNTKNTIIVRNTNHFHANNFRSIRF
jgi:hypothetical protein